MIKKYFKKKFYNKDLDYITDKTERFVVLMNDFKQNMGAWYSILALRVIPFLLFIVPTNVVIARITLFIKNHYLTDFNWQGPILMALWAAAMAILLVLTILLPKVATVYEYAFGLSYLFFVFKNHLYNHALGIALMICMILFLLVKTFFLVVKIIGMRKFAGDADGVERDESGRKVRATEGDVFYVESEKRDEIDKDRPLATADNDFLFKKTDDVQSQGAEARMAFDDDYFIGNVKEEPDSTAKSTYDDDFFFTKDDKNEKNVPLAGSDDDFVF